MRIMHRPVGQTDHKEGVKEKTRAYVDKWVRPLPPKTPMGFHDALDMRSIVEFCCGQAWWTARVEEIHTNDDDSRLRSFTLELEVGDERHSHVSCDAVRPIWKYVGDIQHEKWKMVMEVLGSDRAPHNRPRGAPPKNAEYWDVLNGKWVLISSNKPVRIA